MARPIPSGTSLTRGSAARPLATARSVSGAAWFALLLAAISFDGLARKLFPDVPGPVFYFAKDGVLLLGLLVFGLRSSVVRTARDLMRGFLPVLPFAVLWTVGQLFNPEQRRIEFGVLGLRSYWLWWIAPLVIATALRRDRDRRRAMTMLGICAGIVAVYAMVQFSLPATDPLNQYAPSALDISVANVASTGRVRVTSTFSYITGFTDFVILVPALLLSIGLAETSPVQRKILLAATVVSAISLPMSGSRAPVLLSVGGLTIVAYAAGLVWTRQGRKVIAVGAVGVTAALLFASDAVQGVRDRFNDDPDETRGRLAETLQFIPPLAMVFTDHPALGLGTGTLQNAAMVLGGTRDYAVESEPGRVLVEQGIPGYLLISLIRIGAVVALFRAGQMLKRRAMKAEAGAAWALAAFTLPGNLFFDHVFQALYFVGVGIVLEATVRARTDSTR